MMIDTDIFVAPVDRTGRVFQVVLDLLLCYEHHCTYI